MKEIWKDIPGFEGRYQVSNIGNIKTLEGKHKEKILKKRISNAGYCMYSLYLHRIYIHKSAHRLVMLAFVGQSNLDVNHKNGIKTDNRLENLEYCTKKDNMRHAFENGLCTIKKGKDHHFYGKIGKYHKDSLRIQQLDLQGNFIKDWHSIADIYRELGISKGNVCMVCKGKRSQAGGYKWNYSPI